MRTGIISSEWLARLCVLAAVLAAIAIPAWGWWALRQDAVTLHARMAETGGWTPENLTAQVGEPLHLRLTSDDVLHSFAVGQSDQAPVDILPGETVDITLTFDQPGKYVFYCTRWCSLNHWRMRGVIEVTGEAQETAQPPEPPLYVSLGIDLDAEPAEIRRLPQARPSAGRGAALERTIPADFWERDYYLTHSPAELWEALRLLPQMQGLSDQDIWDIVAWVWVKQGKTEDLAQAEGLYATNCAACHGEAGGGDGIFSDELAVPAEAGEHTAMPMTGQMTQRPADFSDAIRMLARSPALLEGKILRGGMGTGMPYWGPIFTEEQISALVAYLWTFQFDE